MTTSRRLAALLATTLVVAGCGHAPETPAADSRPPLTVRVLHAGGGAGAPLVLPARVTAREEVTITARLAARLTALPLREGDAFRRGATLATFDAPETRAALAGAEAGLAAATLQRDLARRQEARIESLLALRVAAVRELEGAQADRRAAEAGWAQARAQVDGFRSGATLEAPFDGVVVRRHADVGVTVGPGQPLLDVRSGETGDVAVSVPESELARLSRTHAEFQVGDGEWRPAALVRVDGMTDAATRSRTARFRPAGGAAPEPGAFARVRLAPAAGVPHRATALTVPASALVRRGELAGVFVAEDGVAHLRWLRLGRDEGAAVQVLAGLSPADAIVADPANLSDGRAVKVTP